MKYQSSIFLSLGAIVIMIICYLLTTFGMLGDSPVGQTGKDSAPLIVPAGYAFAIWGIIYTGLIAFPIFQLIKKRSEHQLWHQVRIWFSLNVIANGLWLVFASYNWLWTTVVIIAFMLVSLYKINTLLIQIKSNGLPVNYWLERLVFSLYFAWITLATVLNVSSALKFYNWDGFGISEVTWTMIITIVAALIAALTVWKYRDNGYAVVIIWAFIALAVKQWIAYPVLAYLAVGVVILFLFLIVWRGRKWVLRL